MTGYWVRHRALFTIILSVCLALIMGYLFAIPYYEQKADIYNAQSLYRNTSIDFVVPEPSFDQANELPGSNGISGVFPYYLTKTSVTIKGKNRTTTVLIADNHQKLDTTMYNQARLIETSRTTTEHPILVDYQFCLDTGAKLGDVVSFFIGENLQDYIITAIYETNSLHDGGAILVQVPSEQIEAIRQQSKNNGFSGMLVTASDYDTCRLYLTTDYRPLGRLQSREQFDSDEQYKIHYDAIMSSGYSNEITDFRIRENTLKQGASTAIVWIGSFLAFAAIIAFNILMRSRGCEKAYFTKYSIPRGQDVSPYYTVSFASEIVLCIAFYAAVMVIGIQSSSRYIPKSTLDFTVATFPIAVILAEIISLILNRSMYRDKAAIIGNFSKDYVTKEITPASKADVSPAGENKAESSQEEGKATTNRVNVETMGSHAAEDRAEHNAESEQEDTPNSESHEEGKTTTNRIKVEAMGSQAAEDKTEHNAESELEDTQKSGSYDSAIHQ